jgi:hypothetical protein
MVSLSLIHISYGQAMTDAPERPGMDTYFPARTTLQT